MIGTILTALLGKFLGDGASKAGGALSGVALMGSVAGTVAWLFGPGREWSITLNALELSGVGLGASLLLEWFRRMTPPGQ